MGASSGGSGLNSVQDLHAILFDHRIRQHFVRDGFNLLPGLLGGDTIGDGDIEELALADIGDPGMAVVVQG